MRDPLEETQLQPRRTGLVALGVVVALVAVGVVNPTALGTIGVLVGIILMIMLHEAGHYLTAKWSDMKVTEFFLGFGPRLLSVRKGETEYGVKAIPAGGYVRIIGMNNLEEVDPADEPRTFRSKPYRNRLMVAVAGSFTHFVMAILLLWLIFAALGVPNPDRPLPVVRALVKEEPAKLAGIEKNDRITAIDGHRVDAWDDVPALVEPHANDEILITVERDGRLHDIAVTPRARELKDGGAVGFLGIQPDVVVEKTPMRTALSDAVTDTFGIAKESIKAVGSFFAPSNLSDYGKALTGQKKAEDENRFLSPVGATQVASQAVEEGLREVLTFLALINIFVGTLNMFPLPPLDGGHVAVATYEKVASMIKRRPVQVDMAKVMPVAAVVVMILLFIGLSALYLDIFQPVDVGF
ncbi:MAG TPA: M50 family metallopeptidase [Acidimicrobiia bacterium]|nr:M50 family metallopeptidase [Acidimicrobiia bacterium]